VKIIASTFTISEDFFKRENQKRRDVFTLFICQFGSEVINVKKKRTISCVEILVKFNVESENVDLRDGSKIIDRNSFIQGRGNFQRRFIFSSLKSRMNSQKYDKLPDIGNLRALKDKNTQS
jgi:hypothetical protein